MTDPLNTLSSAITTPDDDVAIPAPSKPISYSQLIAELQVGETASKVRRQPDKVPLEFALGDLSQRKEAMRNSISSMIRTIKQRTGGEYTHEVTELLTSRGLYIVSLVTRTA